MSKYSVGFTWQFDQSDPSGHSGAETADENDTAADQWIAGVCVQVHPSQQYAFVEESEKDPSARRADQFYAHASIPRFGMLREGEPIEFKLRQSTVKEDKLEIGALRAAAAPPR